MEYASKATGGTALGLGIAGTAGWLLNGGLGNLFRDYSTFYLQLTDKNGNKYQAYKVSSVG